MMNGIGHERTALVLYGTETGTAQDVAEEVGRLAQRLYFDVDVLGFDDVAPLQLPSYTVTILVIATTGQGDFPNNSLFFWKSLLKKKLPRNFLQGVFYALAGLGDSSYPKFNWAARKLDKRLQQLGAEAILTTCEADEQDDEGTEGVILPWLQNLSSELLSKYPLLSGTTPILPTQQLPSKWTLVHASTPGPPHLRDAEISSSLPHYDGRPTAGGITTVLRKNERVTPDNHWQDVRHLELLTDEKVEYLPGDALAILPKNFTQDVDLLISLMHWDEVADSLIALKLNPLVSQPSRVTRSPIPDLENHSNATLRTILTDYLDITAIPKRSFFAAMARYTNDEMHKERLTEFTDPQFLDEYFDYATRPRRSILEVLQEFDSVRIPWQEACNVFPVIRPRQFSIASGVRLAEGDTGTAFELLVAIVKYRTVIKKIRQGVCTRYLAALAEGSTLQVVLRTEGRFKIDYHSPSTQNLLIGAGTGIAPLRALIQKENFGLALTNQPGSQTNTLIFGARSKNADFFFENEWTKMAAEETLHFSLVTAFSRDQKQKIYVQDKIRENGEAFARLLRKSEVHVFVCGSSGAMPKAVRAALTDVLTQHASDAGPWTADDSEDFVSALEKQGRYIQETW